MITGMRLREFFARLAPAKIGLIARDCGVAAAEDRVDALVAYSQNYGLGVIHWRVRYPNWPKIGGALSSRWPTLTELLSRKPG